MGGVLFFDNGNITLEASEFRSNNAKTGGVLHLSLSNITIKGSEFHNNSATDNGGVLLSINGNIIKIHESEFHNNNATNEGGVMLSYSSNITLGGSIFTKNGSPIGAVISFRGSTIQSYNYLLIDDNWAEKYAVIYLSDSKFIGHGSENVMFSSNLGSLVAFNSDITFMGYTRFVNNQPPQTTIANFQEGGAITLLQSNAYFDGVCILEHNFAENGGAILSIESKLYVNRYVAIAHNTATRNGGGVYLTASQLNCERMSTLILFNNTAVQEGEDSMPLAHPSRQLQPQTGSWDTPVQKYILYKMWQRRAVDYHWEPMLSFISSSTKR